MRKKRISNEDEPQIMPLCPNLIFRSMLTKETAIWGKWSDPSACGPLSFSQLKPQKPQLEKYPIEKLKVSLFRKKSFSIISN